MKNTGNAVTGGGEALRASWRNFLRENQPKEIERKLISKLVADQMVSWTKFIEGSK